VIPRLALALAVLSFGRVAAAQSFDELLRTGRLQNDSGKYENAIKTLEKAVKLNANSAEAHFQLGRAIGSTAQTASKLRQPVLARRIKSEFEKTVTLDPTHIPAREGLISFYLMAPGVMGGSVSKAREQADAIRKINPLRGYLADATVANDQTDAAAAGKAYAAAVAEFPDSLNAVTSFVSFVSNNGRTEEAFAPLERFLAKHPSHRLALYWLGRTSAVTGKQLARGEEALRAVLATHTDTGPRILRENVHFRLGDIAAKGGDKAKARAEYEAALKINPKMESARRALAGL
jgi:tetratricopeptide (TPR) repeat protein